MDIYDGAEWTDMDVEDFEAELECGRSITEAAEFLCRADSVEMSGAKRRNSSLG
jgi:hypothetical protein